ncbi:MAG: hypothetical protein HZA53_04305 [Planctomycetes bacterium]|nr:hypothetical protein [Planctomycetota bacterium]
MRALLPILCVFAAACATGPEPALRLGVSGVPPDVDRVLRAAQSTLQGAAQSGTAWCDLGEAWLAAARSSHEVESVKRALASIRRARVLAGPEEASRVRRREIELALFRERRAEALALADRAVAEFPHDVELVNTRIEVLLANERVPEAAAALAELDARGSAEPAARLRVAAARRDRALFMRVYLAQQDAVDVHFARALASTALQVGDLAPVGRMLGRCARAASDAEVRRTLELALAEAELAGFAVRGNPAYARAALERAERLVTEAESPLARVVAARAARKLVMRDEERWHANAAEAVFRRSVDAGEVYALAPLARLLMEHELDLDEANELARRWARLVPDADARALVEQIELLRAKR